MQPMFHSLHTLSSQDYVATERQGRERKRKDESGREEKLGDAYQKENN